MHVPGHTGGMSHQPVALTFPTLPSIWVPRKALVWEVWVWLQKELNKVFKVGERGKPEDCFVHTTHSAPLDSFLFPCGLPTSPTSFFPGKSWRLPQGSAHAWPLHASHCFFVFPSRQPELALSGQWLWPLKEQLQTEFSPNFITFSLHISELNRPLGVRTGWGSREYWVKGGRGVSKTMPRGLINPHCYTDSQGQWGREGVRKWGVPELGPWPAGVLIYLFYWMLC